MPTHPTENTAFKAVIFDLDGTLLDTIEDIAASANQALSKLDFPEHDLDEYKLMVGEGILYLIESALPEKARDVKTIAKCATILREEYSKRWHVKTKAYDGVPELLDALEDRNIVISILSNKPQDFTQANVDRFLQRWKFSAIIGANDHFPKKPDPAGALAISRKLNIDPCEFIFLGDTKTDMQTACAAGMHPIGALWGFRSAKELEENGAESLIEKPCDLINFF